LLPFMNVVNPLIRFYDVVEFQNVEPDTDPERLLFDTWKRYFA